MSVLITDTGFGPDDWAGVFGLNGAIPGLALHIGPDTNPEDLRDDLAGLQMIRIHFPNFADGRGFSIARRLRLLGYKGRLRAFGHVLADQYTMARRSGFDEVEISDDLAARQPQEQWMARANWQVHDYQSRLRGAQ